MVKIKAAVCHEFGAPLQIEIIDLREPLSGEVEITLGAVAVCHSDISFADGDWGGDLLQFTVTRPPVLLAKLEMQ